MDAKRGFIQFIPMIVLGLAAVSTFFLLGALGKNQDIRGRAAVITSYRCEIAGEDLCYTGTIVSSIYCGSTCRAPAQECCKTTTTVADTSTVAPVNTQTTIPTTATTQKLTISATLTPTPTKTPTPTSIPSCGKLYASCCGSYPTGRCDTGLYCSNIDSGTCMTIPTPTPTRTPTPTPTPPSTFCTGPNNQKMSSSYTCVVSYHGTFNESNGQGCCTLGTAPTGTATCTLATKPVCSGNGTPTCTGTTWTCPLVVTPACTSGQKQCSGTELQTCSGGIWISQYCPDGCTNGACKQPTPTPTPKPSCSGTCITGPSTCYSAGKAPATGTCAYPAICCGTGPAVNACTQGETYCVSATTVAVCKADKSGYTTASCTTGTTCDDTQKKCIPVPITNPFAKLNELGLPSGLSGNGSVPIPMSAVVSQAGFQQYTNTVLTGVGTGLAVGGLTVGGATLLPAGGLPVAAVMAQNALATLPAWVSPTLTVAGTLPGVYSNTKCLLYPDLCTEADRMNIFMTGVGVQQMIDEQAIKSLAAQRVAANQAAQDVTYVLLGDTHSDFASMKAYLQEQGVIDALGNPTGKQVIVVGDYFGKTTTAMSKTGGNDVLDYVSSLPGVKIIGNNDLRCVAGVCALQAGDQAALDAMLNKTISLDDIQAAANDPLFAEKIGQLDYVSVLPGSNTVVQHVDTAEFARFALTPDDLAALSKTNPELAQQIANITSLDKPFQALTPDDLSKINQAVSELNLSTSTVVDNINTQADAITQAALANPTDATAINNLSTLQNTMDQELAFYNSNASQTLTQYQGILSDNTTTIDTFVYGHSPVSRMEPIVNGGYNGLSTDLGSGVTLVNVDQSLSTGMRIPRELWSPPVGGLTQVPAGTQYMLPAVVPNTLTTGLNGTFVTFPQ